jgi:hypothetical protein
LNFKKKQPAEFRKERPANHPASLVFLEPWLKGQIKTTNLGSEWVRLIS